MYALLPVSWPLWDTGTPEERTAFQVIVFFGDSSRSHRYFINHHEMKNSGLVLLHPRSQTPLPLPWSLHLWSATLGCTRWASHRADPRGSFFGHSLGRRNKNQGDLSWIPGSSWCFTTGAGTRSELHRPNLVTHSCWNNLDFSTLGHGPGAVRERDPEI